MIRRKSFHSRCITEGCMSLNRQGHRNGSASNLLYSFFGQTTSACTAGDVVQIRPHCFTTVCRDSSPSVATHSRHETAQAYNACTHFRLSHTNFTGFPTFLTLSACLRDRHPVVVIEWFSTKNSSGSGIILICKSVFLNWYIVRLEETIFCKSPLFNTPLICLHPNMSNLSHIQEYMPCTYVRNSFPFQGWRRTTGIGICIFWLFSVLQELTARNTCPTVIIQKIKNSSAND